MTNEAKQAITQAIDAAGFSWQVQENSPVPLVDGEKIVVTEIVTFTATKRTEVPRP